MMMRLCLVSVVSLGIATGCGSSASPGPSATVACTDVATARCNQRSMCSVGSAGAPAPGVSVVRVYGNMVTCIERETLACQNGLTAAGTGNTPAKVEKCVGAFATYSCQDFFDNNPPADCAPTGSRANGGTCTFNGQCQSGYCQGTKTSVCGTCADPPTAGADCSDSTCGHNQRCLAASMTCGDVTAMNGACDSTHPCDNGLVCVGATTTATGTCMIAATSVGAPCGAGMPSCDNTLGLYCAGPAGAKTCMQMALVGDGMPCGTLADGTRAECVAGDCYTTTGPAAASDLGTCRVEVRETAASPRCDTNLGPSCLPPARCVVSGTGTTGTCVVPTAVMCPG